ncbi:MAG: unnamed protein product [uncultured Paraburkholderia sp.]|nr:MAG: unnamed protein product [uncultured Paraburkholderia sp.]
MTYLEREGFEIPRTADLEEAMVAIADNTIDYEIFASYLSAVWSLSNPSSEYIEK